MKRIRLKKTTCFGFGIAAACMTMLTGILMLAGVGEAQYAQTASLVLGGGMLLFLGVYEKGDANRKLRTKLLALFFALVIAFLRLPPLDWLEVLVLPCLLALYGDKARGYRGWMVLLIMAEILSAAVRTLILTSLFGAYALQAMGGALVVTGLVRAVVLLGLFRQAAEVPTAPDDGRVRRLR